MGNDKTPHPDRVRTIPTEERSIHTKGKLTDPLQQASLKLSHQLSDNFAQHSLLLFIVSWANPGGGHFIKFTMEMHLLCDYQMGDFVLQNVVLLSVSMKYGVTFFNGYLTEFVYH